MRWRGGEEGGVGAVCECLLEAMRIAGAVRALVVLDEAKDDVARYLGDGGRLGLDLAYLGISSSPSVPATVDRARGWVEGDVVLFGFPDILFEPLDALARLVERREQTGADVVLGLFPAPRPETADVVETGADGTVRRILVKQPATDLRHAWILAVWSPRFTAFLHDRVRSLDADGGELQLGHVLQAAVDEGLLVGSLAFADGWFVDVGTREGLRAALARAGTSAP